ncbi:MULTISPECIES: hypothetical protein [unclassified Frankia]|uniref:hypothetical protein n=1 Tax=unclassified Frankia TaxID=2632575 RepID=UPI002AD47139|nr:MULTISPECIES: hypothetical protein [unclassified Frankia]
MAVLLFPDNTVLINFAIINRMDLLERLANGNGHWCATVASECDSSAQRPGLSALANAKDRRPQAVSAPHMFNDLLERHVSP